MTRQFDIANGVDDLRQRIAKADALVHAAEDLFNAESWAEDAEGRRVERLAHLIGATVLAVDAAREGADELAAELSTLRARAVELSTGQPGA